MAWFSSHLLTTAVFLPLIGALGALLVPVRSDAGRAAVRVWSFLSSIAVLVACFAIYQRFNSNGPEFQMLERLEWIPSLGISYALAIDGISLWLMLLTAVLTPIAILSSFRAVDRRTREYYALLLALETGMLGAFAAHDLFLFYVFWESMLVPMYFLIGIWGGSDRIYAAMRFFIYTAVGSLLMLVAIFYLCWQHQVQYGQFSTFLPDLYRLHIAGGGYGSPQSLLFLAFALAFAIKVPLFPLHTWLPDAHVQAPTAGSVILAGVLLKMGGYGFIRYAFPFFPDAVRAYQGLFMALGAIAVVYGAAVALVQPDIKKLVAYSSVSHMGYVILGLFSLNTIAATGSVYQMLNHGISTGGLFLLVGMVYERRHTREISAFGGIARAMPLYAVAFMVLTLSSIALPGTNGFVGEFLILLGSWKSRPLFVGIAGLGVVLGAVYMLWLLQRVLLGPIDKEANRALRDLSVREAAVLVPLLIAVVWMGVQPGFFFRKMQPSIDRFLARSQAKALVAEAKWNH